MKQKPGMVTRALAGELMVLPSDPENRAHVLTLNGSGGFVWRLLETERSFDELVSLVTAEYGIDEDVARSDLAELLEAIKPYIE